MKKFLTLSLLTILSAWLVGCGTTTIQGSGDVITETQEIGTFTNLELQGLGEVIITQGETPSLNIITDDNLQEYFDATVEGDTLTIGRPVDDVNSEESILPTQITFELTVTTLDNITILGAGSLTADNYSADALDIDVEGAGEITLMNVDLETLDVAFSGAGRFEASGNVTDLTVDIDGAGEVRAFDLETTTANISLDGAGTAQVNVSDTLTGNVSGIGSITYRGEPTVTVDQSGPSSVRPEGN